jgi:hypothetical protein
VLGACLTLRAIWPLQVPADQPAGTSVTSARPTPAVRPEHGRRVAARENLAEQNRQRLVRPDRILLRRIARGRFLPDKWPLRTLLFLLQAGLAGCGDADALAVTRAPGTELVDHGQCNFCNVTPVAAHSLPWGRSSVVLLRDHPGRARTWTGCPCIDSSVRILPLTPCLLLSPRHPVQCVGMISCPASRFGPLKHCCAVVRGFMCTRLLLVDLLVTATNASCFGRRLLTRLQG